MRGFVYGWAEATYEPAAQLIRYFVWCQIQLIQVWLAIP